jgi:hypothetical protein
MWRRSRQCCVIKVRKRIVVHNTRDAAWHVQVFYSSGNLLGNYDISANSEAQAKAIAKQKVIEEQGASFPIGRAKFFAARVGDRRTVDREFRLVLAFSAKTIQKTVTVRSNDYFAARKRAIEALMQEYPHLDYGSVRIVSQEG